MAIEFKKAIVPTMPTKVQMRKISIASRFWLFAGKQTGCWDWQGLKDVNGYGVLKDNGKRVRAHRFSYEFNVGKIPAGAIVMHTCDNPACTNPNHLVVGTPALNAADRTEKCRGGSRKGEANGRAKLTTDKVQQIKSLFRSGMYTKRGLGEMFGVSDSAVFNIVSGKAWGK